MKLKTTLAMVAMGVLLSTGYAAAETAQREKMKTCNDVATSKGMKGEDRKAFMKTCLSREGAAEAAKNPQQEKMKTCNADAKAKDLKGEVREAFMKRCLSK